MHLSRSFCLLVPVALALVDARPAAACSLSTCAFGVVPPAVANFSANAVRFAVEPRIFDAIAKSVYIQDVSGRRIEVVVREDPTGFRWIEPAEPLTRIGEYHTLHHDGRCVALPPAVDTGPAVAGEIAFFVGAEAPEPPSLLKGLSVAELSLQWADSGEANVRLTLLLEVTDEARPHVGRMTTAVSINDRPLSSGGLELIELPIDCREERRGQLEYDSCGRVFSVGNGTHRLVARASLVGGAPQPDRAFDLAIDCAQLRRGVRPTIQPAGATVAPVDAGGPAPADGGAPDAAAPPSAHGVGGCAVGGRGGGGVLLIALALLARRRR
jgi:hypothetical protein